MAVSSYDVGDKARVTATFGSGSIDPSTVVAKVKNPLGQVTTYTYGTDAALVRSSLGVYYIDVSLTVAGTWWVRFESTGTGQAAEERELRALPSKVSA
jgi:hypothetical protein